MTTQARDLGRSCNRPTPRERAICGLPDQGAEEKQHANNSTPNETPAHQPIMCCARPR